MDGTVYEVNSKGFAFIRSDDGKSNIFLHISDIVNCRIIDMQKLKDERVNFELQINHADPKKKYNAKHIKLYNPYSQYVLPELFQWADMRPLDQHLKELADLALDESWSLGSREHKNKGNYPLLKSYIIYTFTKLRREGNIFEIKENDPPLASFNTGLVDSRYEPIYAMFGLNDSPTTPEKPPWKILGFAIAGEDKLGKMFTSSFQDKPPRATYFTEIKDLYYDNTKKTPPDVDWKHIIEENTERLPPSLLEDNCPNGIEQVHIDSLSKQDRKAYIKKYSEALKNDPKKYRAIQNRLRDALDLALKRTEWNYKTAIPIYYATEDRMSLLLPLSIVDDEHVDAALVVDKGNSGNYQGETIYFLDWAYKCARLVCRPDSDWLTPELIREEKDIDESDDVDIY